MNTPGAQDIPGFGGLKCGYQRGEDGAMELFLYNFLHRPSAPASKPISENVRRTSRSVQSCPLWDGREMSARRRPATVEAHMHWHAA